MRRFFNSSATSILAIWLVSVSSALSQELAVDELWKLVAKSHIIVDGVSDIPVDQIQATLESGKSEYVNISVRVTRRMKGDEGPETILVRYYTGPDSHTPSAPTLSELNGKPSVPFLTQVDTLTITHAPEIYFAGHTPEAIQPSSRELVDRISGEVSAQREIIKHFARHFRPENDPAAATFRELIEATSSRWTQQRAFAGLEATGESGVPAMIMFIDDRRRLPIHEMSLRNGPGGVRSILTLRPRGAHRCHHCDSQPDHRRRLRHHHEWTIGA